MTQTLTPAASQDQDHLRVLSIVYYVFAGLNCIGLCIGLIYLGVGGALLLGGASSGKGEPAIVGGVLVGVAIFVLLIVCTVALLHFLTGRFIAQHRRRMFCLVVAGLTCLSFPLGTALGVFTFIVLSRPSVKALFEEAERPLADPTPMG